MENKRPIKLKYKHNIWLYTLGLEWGFLTVEIQMNPRLLKIGYFVVGWEKVFWNYFRLQIEQMKNYVDVEKQGSHNGRRHTCGMGKNNTQGKWTGVRYIGIKTWFLIYAYSCIYMCVQMHVYVCIHICAYIYIVRIITCTLILKEPRSRHPAAKSISSSQIMVFNIFLH